METERIALNQRERERLKVTDRQVRRLLLALAERGDGAMVHGLRGRAEDSDPGTAAVCGLWADPGSGAKKRLLEFWQFPPPGTSNSR